jgi:hypothetical protein
MKRTIFLLLLLAALTPLSAQDTNADSVAILLLDRMSTIIGEMDACSFHLHTAYDVPDNSFFAPVPGIGLVKHFDEHQVYLQGPDRMLVNSVGDKGHRGYWNNGSAFVFYSYDENNYSYIDAPGNIVEAMHTLNSNYGLDFPAADFFYPTFVDDLIKNNKQIVFLGTGSVNGQPAFRIAAAGPDKSIQLWISDDARTLPLKMNIVYLDSPDRPQYEATFSNWQINPQLPASVFEFLPPPNAKAIRFLPKTTNR